jgi:hypothetical protein
LAFASTPEKRIKKRLPKSTKTGPFTNLAMIEFLRFEHYVAATVHDVNTLIST